ncbi:major facilitator superfamily domain-containing protein 6-like [Penaeus japonicus]|uniref:major facilitator superfamily domain-containing protein 6-like n=1 Tax=Penaeus japonicus TaxID=27405 RepID=UPI001C711855|nr:major facilitator superfamily domain-containing protein 6-like [Penaeus japonicus]XP_042869246.1 major facilitator superfamily domain-containing protein 6-like [Penaeus japonicus]XP_042869254.1 major facilitator superfamily domain-containing protein 6-like [Penaeus japonicus]
MGINWKMFPMKVHYFLRFAGVGPLMPFLPVIVREKGIPVHYVGAIWTVLSMISLGVKATTGPLADRLNAHRAVMASCISLLTAALSCIYWVPDLRPSSAALDVKDSHDLPAAEVTVEYLMHQSGFWVLFTCLLIQFCCQSASVTLQEALCYQLLGNASQDFGKQRLWGSLGWGFGAVTGGLLVDWYSQGELHKEYWPAYVMTAVFLLMDVGVVTNLKFTSNTTKITFSVVYGVLSQPSTVIILLATLVLGAACSTVDTFQFMLVEDLLDPGYPYLKILEGLMLGVQCLASEVPFFFVAGRIIKRIGYFNAYFISLMFFCLRFSLLSCINNPWWFLLIQLLHGLSFSLAYASLTSYASNIAPPGTDATMQAIFGIAYFGGGGVGSFVVGNLFHNLGGKTAFLVSGLFCGAFGLAFHAVRLLLFSRGAMYQALKTTEDH